MDLKELKEILQILDEKEITEFELEEQGMKLRIRKAASASPNHAPAGAPAPSVVSALAPTMLPGASGSVFPASVESRGGAAASSAAAPVTLAATESGLAVVKSPIVGTFYRSPDPNSPSFVSVGDHVKIGQVLCIIEAMKLMNEIEAEVAGEVMRIHRENGQPVQYGEPLFSIRLE